MSVITVTLNPAIDETVVLDKLQPGHVHRASGAEFHAGGKGVNVASCLADYGIPAIATGILGAGNADVFESLFAAKNITDKFTRVPGLTRTNIKLAHDGDTTDINLPGLTINEATTAKLRAAILSLATQPPAHAPSPVMPAKAGIHDFPATPDAANLVLLAGSVPAGISETIYAELTKTLTTAGARVVLDTSGAPLTAALTAKHLPYCIKPNRSELESFAGRALPANADLIAVAKSLNASGIALVIISLGAEGSLYVTGEKILHASLPAIRAASTVGAGDAMVAGIIAALQSGADLEAIARLATAFAAAKLTQPGPNLPDQKTVNNLAEQVKITYPEEPKE
jgi:1-phosphofructokinase